MEFTIENNFLCVRVQSRGAELCSVVKKETGEEMLWQADPAAVSYTHLDVYKRQDIILAVHSDCPPLEEVVCKLHSTMWGKSLWIFS